jgi:hypothetical protein
MEYEAFLRGIAWTQDVWTRDEKRRKLPQDDSYEALRRRVYDYWIHLRLMTEAQLGKEVISEFLNTRRWNCHLDSPERTNGKMIVCNLKEALEHLPECYIALRSFELANIDFHNQNVLSLIAWIYSKFRQIKPRFGPVPASKLMHMALPNLFMMWDNAIFKSYRVPRDLFGERSYVAFLLLMQENIRHIKETHPVGSCMTSEELSRQIIMQCGYDDLPITRLLDMANYAVGHPEMAAPAIKCQRCIEMTNRRLDDLQQDLHLAELTKTLQIGRYRY